MTLCKEHASVYMKTLVEDIKISDCLTVYDKKLLCDTIFNSALKLKQKLDPDKFRHKEQ